MQISPTEKPIDYPAMIDEAMRGVVAKALRQVAAYGLPGEHHFYISFSTTFPGVGISPALRERFPQDMTIVLQHQFWGLEVAEDHFTIMLSFNNIPEKLVVPYTALTAFADPSIKFGLQFHTRQPMAANTPGSPLSAVASVEASFDAQPTIAEGSSSEEAAQAASAQILSLDAFRKK